MPEIHRTPAVEAGNEPAAVVIHCSDPRYQLHFQHFLRESLGLDQYALLAVPGGAQFLTLVEYLPKFSWVGWRWLKFVVDLTKSERVVLIAHDDCRWYISQRFANDEAHARQRVVDDLRRVRAGLIERFGARHVDLYFARLEDGHARFESL